MPIGGDVEGFIIMEEFQNVSGGWRVDDGGGDELVHCFMVVGFAGVVNEAGAADVDAAG